MSNIETTQHTPKSSNGKFFISIIICLGVGSLSGYLTGSEMNTWFRTIQKPDWNPPGFLFGPVWTLLYLMMGIALWIVWKSEVTKLKKNIAILFFSIQLIFNFLWSIIFFKYHSPFYALLDIILLWLTIIITMFLFRPISKRAFYLLIPYICWVTFATALNYAIWQLNKYV
jgi:tryptophan-rich sensory protein